MKSKLRNNWRQIPWAARCTIVVSVVVITFYSVENFRGWYALKKYREYWEAKGEWFDLADKPEVEIKPGETNLLDYVAVKNLIDNPDSFDIWSIDENLADELLKGVYKNWRNCLLFPFEEIHSLSPENPVTRRKAAQLFLDKIAHWNESLDHLEAAVFDADFLMPETSDSLLETEFPYASPLLMTSRTVKYRASARIATNEPDKACDDICFMIKTGNLIAHKEATLLELLVASSQQQSALSSLWEGLKLRRWNEQHLARFTTLIKTDHSKTIPGTTYQLERLYTLEAMQAIDSFPERLGGPDQFSFMLSGLTDTVKIPEYVPLASAMEEFLSRALFCLIPDGWIDLWTVQLCETRRVSMEVQSNIDYSPKYTKIWKMPIGQVGDFEEIKDRIMEAKTTLSIAATAIAIERYRIAKQKYPENLEDLVPGFLPETPTDLFSGKPLIYIPAGVRSDRPVIYSVGKNRKDDNGYPAKNRKKGDIVWQYDFPTGFNALNYDRSEIPSFR